MVARLLKTMSVQESTVWEVLRSIDDPEMPISIVDLGIVVRVDCRDGTIAIDITPTYTGCPALDMIDGLIKERVGQLNDVQEVVLRHVFDPPWSAARISADGRARLAGHGVTVAAPELVQLGLPADSAVPCPFCGSSSTRVDSPFGPTRCRATHYCEACRNPFEHIKSAATDR